MVVKTCCNPDWKPQTHGVGVEPSFLGKLLIWEVKIIQEKAIKVICMGLLILCVQSTQSHFSRSKHKRDCKTLTYFSDDVLKCLFLCMDVEDLLWPIFMVVGKPSEKLEVELVVVFPSLA